MKRVRNVNITPRRKYLLILSRTFLSNIAFQIYYTKLQVGVKAVLSLFLWDSKYSNIVTRRECCCLSFPWSPCFRKLSSFLFDFDSSFTPHCSQIICPVSISSLQYLDGDGLKTQWSQPFAAGMVRALVSHQCGFQEWVQKDGGLQNADTLLLLMFSVFSTGTGILCILWIECHGYLC